MNISVLLGLHFGESNVAAHPADLLCVQNSKSFSYVREGTAAQLPSPPKNEQNVCWIVWMSLFVIIKGLDTILDYVLIQDWCFNDL